MNTRSYMFGQSTFADTIQEIAEADHHTNDNRLTKTPKQRFEHLAVGQKEDYAWERHVVISISTLGCIDLRDSFNFKISREIERNKKRFPELNIRDSNDKNHDTLNTSLNSFLDFLLEAKAHGLKVIVLLSNFDRPFLDCFSTKYDDFHETSKNGYEDRIEVYWSFFKMIKENTELIKFMLVTGITKPQCQVLSWRCLFSKTRPYLLSTHTRRGLPSLK